MTTTPQPRLVATYPNSGARSSGKRGRNSALTLAAELARKVGMVPTWPNVQTIRLAIESEAEHSEISLAHAAALIVQAALERSFDPQAGIVCRSSWEHFQLAKKNAVDRFWFEDARWRMKECYWALLGKLQAAAEAAQ